MRQEDIEMFAFLHLCGKKDRDLVNGKTKMNMGDFERLGYLTQTLGLSSYNIAFWNQYAEQFLEQFDKLGRFLEEKQETGETELLEEDMALIRSWATAFYEDAPNKKVREYIQQELGDIIEK